MNQLFSWHNRNLTLSIVFLCFAILLVRVIYLNQSYLTWDVFGYYLYLPAKFIYHDPYLQNQEWLNNLMAQYQPSGTLYQVIPLENGNAVIKYSVGLAILFSPFFFAGHLIANILQFPTDGLSAPYQYAILTGGVLTAFTGIFMAAKVLRNFFSPSVTSIALFLIVLGTNYLQLTSVDGTLLTHNYLFLLYSVLIYHTIRWHQKPNPINALMAGLTCGLITIVRPSEMVSVVIPLLYGTTTHRLTLHKLSLIKNNPWQVRLFIIAGLTAVIPQLVYWKLTTGQLFFYSYRNPGEGFEFGHPYILDFLFSFRKGWLLYTPLMWLVIIGFIPLFKRNKTLFLGLLVFSTLHIWIAASWTCWWYAGGSFSSRSMVAIYPLLAIPLGYLVEHILQSRTRIKATGFAIAFILVCLNLFQSWQFRSGILDHERMTKAFYKAIWLKTSIPQGAEKLLLVNRSDNGIELFRNEADYQSKIIYNQNFGAESHPDQSTHAAFYLTQATPYSPGPDITYSDITKTDHAWIRVEADLTFPENYSGAPPVLVTTFHHQGEAYKYSVKKIVPDSASNSRKTISLKHDYLTPEVRSSNDNFKTYVWFQSGDSVQLNRLKVTIFEKKNLN